MTYPKIYDVIVAGGGHADTEAAFAAARMGAQTLLLPHNIETLGQMSCNPFIGSIGRSHLVRELGILDGVMALATDEPSIRLHRLNANKGAAMRATHAQTDRILYKAAIRKMLESQENLELSQQAVEDVTPGGERISGVVTAMGMKFEASAAVLTAGTFPFGKIHIGLENYEGGCTGDPTAKSLGGRLRKLSSPQGRLKTDTPLHIDEHTIGFPQLTKQPSDAPVSVMSVCGSADMHPRQVSCWITHTSTRTREIIRSGFNRSPMFTGKIEDVGPRYYPPIEDRINRFANRDSHRIFLEPEGLTTYEYYPNGISTNLPFDIQIAFMRSIKGLENAHILRPDYIIEYDYSDPRNLKANLETKTIQGFFFTRQINGTTGYEEAAAQGLLASVNVVRYVRERDPLLLRHEQAYLGVLVDDLITKGVNEPCHILINCAEYRLQLRGDSADMRLTEDGYKIGLVGEEQWRIFNEKREAIERGIRRLEATWYMPQELAEDEQIRVLGRKLSREASLHDLLCHPNLGYITLVTLPDTQPETVLADSAVKQVEIQVKYQGYVDRQNEEIDNRRDIETLKLPGDIDHSKVKGLSAEVQQKFNQRKPGAIDQASRISGVTLAAMALLVVHLKHGLKNTK